MVIVSYRPTYTLSFRMLCYLRKQLLINFIFSALLYTCRLVDFFFFFGGGGYSDSSMFSCIYLPGTYCIKHLPEKNSGYFNRSFLPMVKSVVNSFLPEFSDFTRVLSPVKDSRNGPLVSTV